MVQRQQNVAEPIPPFYIRTLISLEAALNAALAKEKEAKKKMNASNARALTAMKQRVRKTVKEYEKEIKQYNDVHVSCKLLILHLLTVIRIRKHSNKNTLPLPYHKSNPGRKSLESPLAWRVRVKMKMILLKLEKVGKPHSTRLREYTRLSRPSRRLVARR